MQGRIARYSTGNVGRSPQLEPRGTQAGSGAGRDVGGEDVVRVAVQIVAGPLWRTASWSADRHGRRPPASRVLCIARTRGMPAAARGGHRWTGPTPTTVPGVRVRTRPGVPGRHGPVRVGCLFRGTTRRRGEPW